MLKPAPVILFLALLSVGCSKKTDSKTIGGPLAATSFENLDGWLADSPALYSLTRDKAHTGQYSTMVGPNHEFSLGYSNPLSRLAPDWPGKLTIGAWVYVPNEQATAKLVVEIKKTNSASANLFWEGLAITQPVKVYNKWQYVEHTVTLPPAATANSRLLVYLWRADSRQPVYMDDLSISLANQK
ncbi:hypothetical protein DNI29_14205 [Hymenobacter sediminis]|uniref:hypothetical protein n=1 Tax=Hymenobacter sediminis TaxID=2218621 RepID=UPI000DA6660B|nr:hypothetical protein [Hymenobacter sediminis]RPD46156.1 hypothetical protein DNI29_14205 [Hymenobacter sediminis]